MPLPSASRIELLPAFQQDVTVWRANDPSETAIIAVKNNNLDTDNFSFYSQTKAQRTTGSMVFIGTTSFGKDGSAFPIVDNDGTVWLYVTESPNPPDSGSLNALILYRLSNKIEEAVPSDFCQFINTMTVGADAEFAETLVVGQDCQLHRFPHRPYQLPCVPCNTPGPRGEMGIPGVGSIGPPGLPGISIPSTIPGPRGIEGRPCCSCCGDQDCNGDCNRSNLP